MSYSFAILKLLQYKVFFIPIYILKPNIILNNYYSPNYHGVLEYCSGMQVELGI